MRNSFFAVLAAVALALGMTVGVADAAHGPHGGPHGGNGGISTGSNTSNNDTSARSGRTVTCTEAAAAAAAEQCGTTLDNGRTVDCSVLTGATSCTDTLQGFGGVGRNGGAFGGGLGGGLDRRGPGGRWPYPGLPGGFPQLLNGNLLSLEALGLVGVNANIDVCSYPSFQSFDAYAGPRFGGGWGMVRNRWFGASQAQQEWLALRQAASCGVVPNGLNGFNGLSGFNGLLNGNFLNLSQYGVSGLSQVNVCQYPSWDAFSGALQPRFGGRWGGLQGRFGRDRGSWMNSFNQLRMQASCGISVAPISQPVYPAPVDPAPVVTPAPVAAPPTVDVTPPPADDASPPAPVAPAPPAGSTIVEVPSGAPNGGDSGLAPDAVWVR